MTGKYIGCPESGCASPSEVVDEELWPSTGGGVMMARVVGVCGHNFLMPAWKLDVGLVFTIDDRTGHQVPLRGF